MIPLGVAYCLTAELRASGRVLSRSVLHTTARLARDLDTLALSGQYTVRRMEWPQRLQMALTFHSARREPLHDSALESENDDRHRRGRYDGRGEDLAPGHLILSSKQRDRDRHSVPLRPKCEREGEQKLVPAINECEYGRRREPRAGQRQNDASEALPTRRAVNHRRLLEIGRQLSEEPHEKPHRERHRECDVW